MIATSLLFLGSFRHGLAIETIITRSHQDPQVEDLQAEVLRLSSRLDALLVQLDQGLGCCPNSCNEGNVSSGHIRLPTTQVTTTTTPPAPSLCAAFGDPHFITFDGAHTTFVGESVLWLVKSRSVWIQALSRDSDGKLLGLAFGGPFLQGHTLVLHKDTHDGPIFTAFDDQVILNQTTDEFHAPGVLDAFRSVTWEDGLHNSRILTLRTRAKFDIGPWPTRFTGAPEGGVFLLKLPENIEVTLTGVDFISTVISMAPQAGGQTGYCGNFNGNADDDAEPIVPSWDRPIGEDLGHVPEAENLFLAHPATAALVTVASVQKTGARRSAVRRPKSMLDLKKQVDACPKALREQAEQSCSRILDARIRQDCVFDVCLSEDLNVVAGMYGADILQEVENAKGVPTFLGHGECLDQAGRRFRAIGTHARTDEACTALLRKLATVRGVLGAQLRRGSFCEVLVEAGTDPTSEAIEGGWGSARQPEGPAGHGLISKTAEDAAWNCWQLN